MKFQLFKVDCKLSAVINYKLIISEPIWSSFISPHTKAHTSKPMTNSVKLQRHFRNVPLRIIKLGDNLIGGIR